MLNPTDSSDLCSTPLFDGVTYKDMSYTEKVKGMKIINVEAQDKELAVTVLIQDGYFFLCSAKGLFEHPFSMFSGAVLSHHGIELLLKACWIWDKNEYSYTHKLTHIANNICFL